MDADRTRNVLDSLLAHVLEAKAELIAHLIVHDARNHDAAGIGERFKPSRHIDAVAKNIAAVDYDVTNIDAMRFELRSASGQQWSIKHLEAKADMCGATRDVRFVPIADTELHQRARAQGH